MDIISTYSLLPLISSVVVVVLGFFVWLKRPRDILAILFFLYCFTIALWLFGTFRLFNAVADEDAIFWDRIIYIGVNFIPIFLYHFGLIYCGITRQRVMLIIGYLLAFLFLPLTQSSFFVDGLFRYPWGVHTRAQFFHQPFLIYFFTFFIAFFVNLLLHYRRASQERKMQVRPVLIGFLILDFIGPLAFLPAYGISVYPVIFLSAIPFVLLLAYAIIRHNALDMKTISAEVFVTFIAIIFSAELFFARTTLEFLLRIAALAALVSFSVLLVRGVKNEVRRREEIQQLAKDLQEANARLTELDHVKSEFLSIAAHQLRTPLSVIKGYTSMMQEGDYGRVPKEMKPILDNVYNSNEHLIHLVDDFLDISRIESGRTKYDFKPLDVSAVVADVANELSTRAKEKGLSVEIKKCEELPMVIADAEKIRHVIYNFVDNAIKYSPKGSIVVACAFSKEEVQCTVTDTGIGMDETDRENLFQKFYRGRNVQGIEVNGTGLGLFVCKKFIEAHQGRIWVESAGPCKGSIFGFALLRNSSLSQGTHSL
ncbi:MAG: PAS/PAC sensor signal transduction histidine kinase [Candidatus Magasanikbacteria bacterium GW2011_GWC2_45_8]|uniref:histidine kinase n=1 Tax=Candidatus Magasanikbacteria bacterium GW2011_GWC2_45_8 TaxID=1619050 RepID=A0A0G1Q644_9BACT|nr:MAG: PAS/PAC sensor signal transduction histidine kinase [Candidatus Magasanikbacteria bacterium GW2011_GWC2_45_8]HBW74131.1 hypothetical protein [Candidatus Magasanikbacteria bacterium]